MDKQIRITIAELIKTLYPSAQAFGWNVLSHDLGEWPGLFRTGDGATHGWIVKRSSAKAEWKNGRRDRKTAVYDVWGFYGFTSGNEEDNSDNEFALIVEAVYEAIKAKPTLDVSGVEGHNLLQIAALTTIDTGEETLHFAQGRLEVMLCC